MATAIRIITMFGLLLLALPALVAAQSAPAENGAASSGESVAPDLAEGGAETEVADPVHPLVSIQLPMLLDELRPDLTTGFFYRSTGRPDPFLPFMATTPTPPEATEELTGLRRFEPGQLSLTAIAVRGGEVFAMVEDSTGRGHIIRPGTLIGRDGRVERITSGRVIIRQPALTLTGEREYRTIEMVLNLEGEQR